MTQARTLRIFWLGLALLLAGCVRDTGESLDIVSPNSAQSLPTFTPFVAEATATQPLLIETTPTDALGLPITEPISTASPTPALLVPATINPGTDVTPTLVILELPLTSPTPLPPTLLPTATTIQVITPVVGNPPQVNIASPTPAPALRATTTSGGTTNNGLLPTPTDLFATTAVIAGECDYIVQNGDNLFRIAVNNGVSLADLLAANELSEQSIIQPGQTVTIPNCTPDETVAATATPASVNVPQPTALPADVTIHRVASGDTLTTIARRYGVSLQAIINANNLTNPDRLQIGQELVIPPQ
jgi:LysM repeat protein